eukprot:6176296-Pleurochrysis_carterae.AAC.3
MHRQLCIEQLCAAAAAAADEGSEDDSSQPALMAPESHEGGGADRSEAKKAHDDDDADAKSLRRMLRGLKLKRASEYHYLTRNGAVVDVEGRDDADDFEAVAQVCARCA